MKRYMYVARRPCGCCCGITDDAADRSTAESVRRFIMDGMYIERVELSVVKSEVSGEEGFMNCIHGQQSLF